MRQWKPLTYRGESFADMFEVSKDGRIRNVNTGKERSLALNKQGYLYCVISRGRKKKIFVKSHRAVAENFVSGNSEGLVINHKDGDKTNNDYRNLEFVSVSENNSHAREMGLWKCDRGSECHNAKLGNDDVAKIREMNSTGKYKQCELAKLFGVKPDSICLILKNKIYKNTASV